MEPERGRGSERDTVRRHLQAYRAVTRYRPGSWTVLPCGRGNVGYRWMAAKYLAGVWCWARGLQLNLLTSTHTAQLLRPIGEVHALGRFFAGVPLEESESSFPEESFHFLLVFMAHLFSQLRENVCHSFLASTGTAHRREKERRKQGKKGEID